MMRLKGLELLIIDALRYAPHPTHFNLEEALEVIAQIAPERALLTHLSHEFDHDKVNSTLPPNVRLSYDGQVIVLPQKGGLP